MRAQWPLLEGGYLAVHRQLTRHVMLSVLPILAANAVYLVLVGVQSDLDKDVNGAPLALLLLRVLSCVELVIMLGAGYATLALSNHHNVNRHLPEASKSMDLSSRPGINGSAGSVPGSARGRGAGQRGATPAHFGHQGGGGNESTFVGTPVKAPGRPADTTLDMSLGSVGDAPLPHHHRGASSIGAGRDLHGWGAPPPSAAAPSHRPSADDDLPGDLPTAHDLILRLREANAGLWGSVRDLNLQLRELVSGTSDSSTVAQRKIAELLAAQEEIRRLQDQTATLSQRLASAHNASEQARAAASEAQRRAEALEDRCQKLTTQVEVEQAANLDLQHLLERQMGGVTEATMSDMSDVEGVSGIGGALIGAGSLPSTGGSFLHTLARRTSGAGHSRHPSAGRAPAPSVGGPGAAGGGDEAALPIQETSREE